jgi:Domain of unknown function (DUF2017)
MFEYRRIARGPDGVVHVRLPGEERSLLRLVAAELAALLDEPDDPDLRRLFPPAYEDAEAQASYHGLVHDGLVSGRVRALDTFRSTLANDTLTEDESQSWLTVLNDARLVLGTRLDVQEDALLDDLGASDPRARDFGVYAYLSWLQEQLVAAVEP